MHLTPMNSRQRPINRSVLAGVDMYGRYSWERSRRGLAYATFPGHHVGIYHRSHTTCERCWRPFACERTSYCSTVLPVIPGRGTAVGCCCPVPGAWSMAGELSFSASLPSNLKRDTAAGPYTSCLVGLGCQKEAVEATPAVRGSTRELQPRLRALHSTPSCFT